MDVPVVHTIEHLGATFLRSHEQWGTHIVYFGPMGCRTGFYAVIEGDLSSVEVLSLFREMFIWIVNFNGIVPGASAKECGNWQDHNLSMAQKEAVQFLKILQNPLPENLTYPE
jgi:S-ribosylhomocysteine lyase